MRSQFAGIRKERAPPPWGGTEDQSPCPAFQASTRWKKAAIAAGAVRPIFAWAAARWCSAVRLEIPKRSAIMRLVSPRATA